MWCREIQHIYNTNGTCVALSQIRFLSLIPSCSKGQLCGSGLGSTRAEDSSSWLVINELASATADNVVFSPKDVEEEELLKNCNIGQLKELRDTIRMEDFPNTDITKRIRKIFAWYGFPAVVDPASAVMLKWWCYVWGKVNHLARLRRDALWKGKDLEIMPSRFLPDMDKV